MLAVFTLNKISPAKLQDLLKEDYHSAGTFAVFKEFYFTDAFQPALLPDFLNKRRSREIS